MSKKRAIFIVNYEVWINEIVQTTAGCPVADEILQSGIQQMEESSRLWGVNKFDLIQIHNLRDWRTHLNTPKGWKDQGKVRYNSITQQLLALILSTLQISAVLSPSISRKTKASAGRLGISERHRYNVFINSFCS
jgi:hypothetical protein